MLDKCVILANGRDLDKLSYLQYFNILIVSDIKLYNVPIFLVDQGIDSR